MARWIYPDPAARHAAAPRARAGAELHPLRAGPHRPAGLDQLPGHRPRRPGLGCTAGSCSRWPAWAWPWCSSPRPRPRPKPGPGMTPRRSVVRPFRLSRRISPRPASPSCSPRSPPSAPGNGSRPPSTQRVAALRQMVGSGSALTIGPRCFQPGARPRTQREASSAARASGRAAWRNWCPRQPGAWGPPGYWSGAPPRASPAQAQERGGDPQPGQVPAADGGVERGGEGGVGDRFRGGARLTGPLMSLRSSRNRIAPISSDSEIQLMA